MDVVLAFLFEIFGEVILGFALDAALRLSDRRTFPMPLGVLFAIVAGLPFGGLSLLVEPNHWIKDPGARNTGLVVIPIAVGLVLAIFGALRKRRERPVGPLGTFAIAAAFAFGITVVRWKFAH